MVASEVRALIQAFAARLESEVRAEITAHAMATIGIEAPKSSRPSGTSLAGVQRSRRLQGQYLGHLRALRGQARARVQRTAQRDGVAAAVKLARRLRPT